MLVCSCVFAASFAHFSRWNFRIPTLSGTVSSEKFPEVGPALLSDNFRVFLGLRQQFQGASPSALLQTQRATTRVTNRQSVHPTS